MSYLQTDETWFPEDKAFSCLADLGVQQNNWFK